MSHADEPEMGLTRADRRRLSDILEDRRAHGEATTSGQSDQVGLIPLDHPDVRLARRYVKYLAFVEDRTYVRPAEVAKLIDLTPQQAGRALQRLAEQGDLEVWKATSGRGRTYRILLTPE